MQSIHFVNFEYISLHMRVNMNVRLYAGRRDAEFTSAAKVVINVTREHIANSKWPKPIKACKPCNVKGKKRNENQTKKKKLILKFI